jgi:hypothetical protein
VNALGPRPHQVSKPPLHPGTPLGRPKGGSLPAAFNLMKAKYGMGSAPPGATGGMFAGQNQGFGLRKGIGALTGGMAI